MYFKNILSKYQCGFRKGYSALKCLISTTEKLRHTLDKGGPSSALLTALITFIVKLQPKSRARLNNYPWAFIIQYVNFCGKSQILRTKNTCLLEQNFLDTNSENTKKLKY